MRQNINEEIKSLRSVFDVEDTVMDTEAEHQGAVEGSDIYKIFDNLYKLFNSLGISIYDENNKIKKDILNKDLFFVPDSKIDEYVNERTLVLNYSLFK